MSLMRVAMETREARAPAEARLSASPAPGPPSLPSILITCLARQRSCLPHHHSTTTFTPPRIGRAALNPAGLGSEMGLAGSITQPCLGTPMLNAWDALGRNPTGSSLPQPQPWEAP